MKFKNNILLGIILFISYINKIDAINRWNKPIRNLNIVPNLVDEVIDIESDIPVFVDADIDVETDISESEVGEIEIESNVPEIGTDIFDIESDVPEIGTDIFDIESDVPEIGTDIFDIESDIPEFYEGEIEIETDVVYSDIRLPDTVLPMAYRLDFYTSLENSSFNGKEEIDIKILKETNSIIFHSENLSLSNITISNESEELKPNLIQLTKDYNFVILNFNETLKSETNYTLHLQYSGKLSTNNGYFILNYYNKDDSLSKLAITQFESADARKAFPCFDEPHLKATFQVNMTVDDGYNALSNMNVVEIKEIENSKQKKYIFANSVKMSTYLVAFMVSEYQPVSEKYNDIDVSVYAIPDRIEDTKYALKLTIKFLKFFENLFKIPYSLPKLDLLELPTFDYGGMENWGLIVFGPSYLLVNEETGTPSEKYTVAITLAHEIAHLWFGDIVTMKWWDELWLKEGFATFLQNLATDIIEPNFGITYEWYINNINIISKEYNNELQPVYNNYNLNPKEEDKWDTEAIYDKGGYIIRMMEFWLNKVSNNNSTSATSLEDTYFFRRIQEYLNLYKYSNADSKQLYEILESYDDKGQPLYHVSEIMESFVNQKGIPIVLMNKNQDEHDQTITLSQDQYVSNDNEQMQNIIAGNSTWVIPYSYSIYSNSTGEPKVLESQYITLDDEKSKSILSLPTKDDETSNTKIFIKGNEDQYGYYLVQYDDESIQVGCEWLKSDLNFMSYINRAGFINDILTQLLDDRTENPATILNCLDYLKNEKSITVWNKVFAFLYKLKARYVNDEESLDLLIKWISDLISNISEDIGWVEKEKEGIEKSTIEDNTIYNRESLRLYFINFALLGERNNKEKAIFYFNEIKNGTFNENLDDTFLLLILLTGVKYGDESDIDFILNELESETSKFSFILLINALTQVSDPSAQLRVLEKFISDPYYSMYCSAILKYYIENGYYIAFTFMRDHWDSFFKEEYLNNDDEEINELINDIYLRSKKGEHSKEIVSWIDKINEDIPDKKISIEDNNNDDNLRNEDQSNDNDSIILWLKEHY